MLLWSSACSKRAADRLRIPAPVYRPGQMVWLSSKDLPLRAESYKLAPRFVCPFPISKVVNPAAMRLKLTRSLRVHPTFHVVQIKPVKEIPLVPASRPPPPPQFIDGGQLWTPLSYGIFAAITLTSLGQRTQRTEALANQLYYINMLQGEK